MEKQTIAPPLSERPLPAPNSSLAPPPTPAVGQDVVVLISPQSIPPQSVSSQDLPSQNILSYVFSLTMCCLLGGAAVYLLLFATPGFISLMGGLLLLIIFFVLLRPLLRGAARGLYQEIDQDQDHDLMEQDLVEQNFVEQELAENEQAHDLNNLSVNELLSEKDQVFFETNPQVVAENIPVGEVSEQQAKLLIQEIKRVDNALSAVVNSNLNQTKTQ